MNAASGHNRIPPPDPAKPPLKANVFHVLRSSNTALVPIFPYVGDGDIVPGATVFWGGEGRDSGVFNHSNSVDEVAICFASEKSRIRAGTVFAGARTHLVGRFFEDSTDPDILMVIVVTQRQAEAGVPQSEALTFMCEKCQTPLLHYEFSAKNERDASAGLPGHFPTLETLTEGFVCLEPHNKSEAARTCPKCGTLNPPFPISVWGWDAYARSAQASERGRRQLLALGQTAMGKDPENAA